MQMGMKATHFDKMAALAHRHFNQLAAMVSDSISGRKVLAAMVMKTSSVSEGIVISLGTGKNKLFYISVREANILSLAANVYCFFKTNVK